MKNKQKEWHHATKHLTMATATAMGDRRGAAAAAEVLTPATAASSTDTAVAAEAAAEVAATAADIKSGPGSGINALPMFGSFFSLYLHSTYFLFFRS
jgi:hypothetical protein